MLASSYLSARMEQLGSTGLSLVKIRYLSIFWKICRENSSFIKILGEERVLYMKTAARGGAVG